LPLLISWDQPFPNLSDPDILIINLNSLTEDVLNRIDKEKYDDAREKIFDKFVNRGILIFITSRLVFETRVPRSTYSNYFLSPIEFEVCEVEDGNVLRYEKKHFPTYLSKVKKFDHYLYDPRISSHSNM